MIILKIRKYLADRSGLIRVALVVLSVCFGGLVLGLITSKRNVSDAGNLEFKAVSDNQNNHNETATNDVSVDSNQRPKVINMDEVENDCNIYSDISGAVLSPGVYCIDDESLLGSLVDYAGGFSENVCKEYVERLLNRALVVTSGTKFYIPYDYDPECVIGNNTLLIPDNSSSKNQVNACISINSASLSELMTISGVGPSTAQKIVDGRPYESIDDLLNVKGIGSVTLEKMKTSICL